MPLRYPRISKHALLLSVPLGKPPYFDGEDYCMWSDKMRHHLTSLHESIWDIVEFGAQVPQVGEMTMTRTRPPKLGTLTPKPRLYSSPPCVERSITRCKVKEHQINLGRPQDRTRRGQGDQDHQTRDDRGGAQSVHPQQRRRAASDV
jgi:hypothetical protein